MSTENHPSHQSFGPLRADEFLPWNDLQARLPATISKEAIRKMFRENALPRHRIGKVTYIYVRELIEASRSSAVDDDEFQEE